MALTKVQKTGITDNAIDADKIEDGTIVAADIAPGTITNAKLAGSIANDKLANSSITVNGTSVSLGGSVSAGKVSWQTVKTADFNAVAGEGYFVDTNSVGAVTATLPGSPSAGDTIAFKDYAANFGTNSLTIARNGNNIQGVANDSEIKTNRASIVLVYIDATKGWLYTNESNVADLELNTFITATGGTITTSGDFKIHSFTGDGCFAVSTIGTGPAGGPSNVDYLVIAGGGGGSGGTGGGGGAGGYRTTFPSPGCNAGAFPISATTYPITVGGGGTGVNYGTPDSSPASGSPSIFSTITSTGGGGGGSRDGAGAGSPGGSGGGGNGGYSSGGGTGNTPPVSPSQGNPGGSGSGSPKYVGGGGGGANSAGSNGSGTSAGPGGNGLANSITGSSVTRAGGGGGGAEAPCGSTFGNGGSGGGGNGTGTPGGVGTNGTANTGGGGGGDGFPGQSGSHSSGGKGIVIIRYKFQ